MKFDSVNAVTLAVTALALLVIGLKLYSLLRAGRLLAVLFTPAALARQLPFFSPSAQRRQVILLGLLALPLAAGLLGPAWGDMQISRQRKDTDILFLVDVSRSMDVSDVKPSRLEKVKQAIRLVAERYPRGRYGIVAFAGEPFYYCPFIAEEEAFFEFLDAMSTGTIAHQGTDYNKAIERVNRLFKDPSENGRMLIVFSDGENNSAELSTPLKADEITAFVFGVGTADGGVVPVKRNDGTTAGTLLFDGKAVTSKYDPAFLEGLAEHLGASFATIDESANAFTLARTIYQVQQRLEQNKAGVKLKPRQSFFAAAVVVLLGLAVFLAYIYLPGVRNLAALLCAGLLWAMPAALDAQQAFDPAYEKLKKAEELYMKRRYEEAARLYEELDGQLTPAQQERRAVTLYNRGNARLQLEQNDAAISDYIQALKLSKDRQLRSWILNNLGMAYKKQEQKKKALQAYRQALREKDNDITRRNIQKLFQNQQQQNQQNQQNGQQQQQGQKKDQQEQKQNGQQGQQGNMMPKEMNPKKNESFKLDKDGEANDETIQQPPAEELVDYEKEMAKNLIEQYSRDKVKREKSNQSGSRNDRAW